MAFTVLEQELYEINGIIFVKGRATSDGGSTGGAIILGTDKSKIDASRVRNIINCSVSCVTASPGNAAQVVKSYSSSADRDIITLTTPADKAYDFFIIGKDNGR